MGHLGRASVDASCCTLGITYPFPWLEQEAPGTLAVVAFSAAMFSFALFHPQDNVLAQLKGDLFVPTDFEDLYQFRRWHGSSTEGTHSLKGWENLGRSIPGIRDSTLVSPAQGSHNPKTRTRAVTAVFRERI